MVSGALLGFVRPEATSNASQRTLTFAQRVAYQRAIEEVYWRHRTWPKERPGPKPSLYAEMSQAQLEKKVADFNLNAWLYYLPDASNPGRYTHNPRWFFNFATGQWITL